MADGNDFSFETLSKQEAVERKQPRLSKLDPAFWEQLQSYLDGLQQNLRTEQQRNPSSRKIALLQDELRNATRKCESLWEIREKKVTLTALKDSRAPGSPAPENALRLEQALYAELVAAIRKYVPAVVTALDKPSETSPTPSAPRPVVVAADAPPAPPATRPVPAPMAAPSPPGVAPASAPKPATDDVLTVRALVDVPPFVGLDGKTYRLKKGDVLALPKKMVDMLAKRGQVAVMA